MTLAIPVAVRHALMCLLLGTCGWSSEAVPGPGITIDPHKREIQVEATVCLRTGILEYLLCRRHTCEHESIFVTSVAPSVVHAALLAIASEPYAYAEDDTWFTRAQTQRSAQLVIEVAYLHEGKTERRPLSRFARNRERTDGVVGDQWIFTGSRFLPSDGHEFYAADQSGGVIGLTSKGASVIQAGERTGIPYRGDEHGLECRTDIIPPVGTAVRVIFRAVQPAAPATP